MSFSTRMHHIIYRSFWIKDTKKNHDSVDQFYGESLSAMTVKVKVKGKVKGKMVIRRSLFCSENKLGLNLDIMKALLEDIQHDNNVNVNVTIMEGLKLLVVNTIHNELVELDKMNSRKNRLIVAKKIMHSLVVCHPIITHALFLETFNKFVYTVLDKCLEFTRVDGLPEAFLVFGLYRPNLCTSEIQPCMNYDTDVYKQTNFKKLRADTTYAPMIADFGVLSGFHKRSPLCKRQYRRRKPLNLKKNLFKLVYGYSLGGL
jgi:hypothetical protein